MNITSFLNLTDPKWKDGVIPDAISKKIESFNSDLYALLIFANKELRAIYHPEDLKGTLTDWDDNAPLQLEYTRDSMGKTRLENIRVRGAIISQYIEDWRWEAADQWLQENVSEQPSESRRQTIARMDRADERQERAA